MDVISPVIVPASAWLADVDRLHGEWQGASSGSGICIIANKLETVGEGPRLHRHPYQEVIFVRTGIALVTIGDRELIVTTGELVFIPAHVKHKFANHGPGFLESVDIHENGEFITEWLE